MWAAFRRLLDRGRWRHRQAELTDELSAHLEFAEADHAARGLGPDAARRAARLALGNPTNIQEAVRDVDAPWLDILWRDLRYALRQLRRTPGFTVVALLSLSIGTAGAITIFGFASTLLFTPLNVTEPAALVRVMGLGGGTTAALRTQSDAHIPAQDFFHYRDENQAFASLAAHFVGGVLSVRVDGAAARAIPVTFVSANYFGTLGVKARLGRAFTPADGRSRTVNAVVLSDVGWRRFFDADAAIVGRTAFIGGKPATIVGVLPPSFTGALAPMLPQIYAPMLESPDTTYRVDLIGRLRPGVTAGQAAADLTRIARQLTARDREMRWIEVYPGSVLQPLIKTAILLVSSLFFAIVGVVLLIACDNIAILLVIRSLRRRHEIAVRLALGASRARLFAQMILESGLLCAIGAGAGIVMAHVTARYLTQFYAPVPMPFALTYTLDWRVAAFTVALSCAATLLCGIAPARQALKTDVVSGLRTSGLASGSRTRSNLIVVPVLLSTALLVVGVVLARSLSAPIAPNSGFISNGVLMSTLGLDSGYTPQRRAAFLQAVIARLEGTPGIASVTAVDSVPLTNNRPITPIEMRAQDGRDANVEQVYTNLVGPALLRTLGIPLVAGRDFTSADNTSAPAVGIANETLARRFWPGESAIGKRLQASDGQTIDIVGVARDAKYESATEPPRAFLYRPVTQGDLVSPTLLVKTMGDASGIFLVIRSRIAELDPDIVPFNLMALNDRLGLGLIVNRTVATVAGGTGLLAMLLSVMGIYGTMAFLGQQRRREIGVRLALGSSRREAIGLITRHGMAWAGVGLALGLGAGLGATMLLRSRFNGVNLSDPMAFVVTPCVLAAAAYLACYVPAWRATRLDPLDALREE